MPVKIKVDKEEEEVMESWVKHKGAGSCCLNSCVWQHTGPRTFQALVPLLFPGVASFCGGGS